MPLDDRAIAISATFTAEAIQPGLAFWVQELGLDYEIRFAGYNQLFQELLDPSGLFARNRGGFNVALVRFDDWLRAGSPTGLEEHARRLVEAVRSAAAKFSAPLILAIRPAPPEHAAGLGGTGASPRGGGPFGRCEVFGSPDSGDLSGDAGTCGGDGSPVTRAP